MDRTQLEQLQTVAYPLPTGKASQFVPSADGGGVVVYVKARLPIDEAKLKEELPAFLNRLRDQRQIAAFSEWFNQASKQMELKPPQRTRS